MRPLKDVGLVLAGIAGFLALVFLMGLYIEGLTWASENLQEYLNIAAKIALAVCVFILLPCALFRATRKFSVYGLLISSVIFGASTWTLGFLVTLHYWGTMGVFVGIFMGVVGIVPVGMLASLFNGDWYAIGILVFGLALTFGARIIAIMVAAWIDRDEAGINSNSPLVSLASQPSRRALVTVLGLVMVGSVGVWLVETPRPISDDTFIADFNRGDFAAMLRRIRPLADQGNASAQYNLGAMYDNGRGVPQNNAEAVKWFRLAANQGSSAAQLNLGAMYDNGRGVAQDYVGAHMWFNLAAAQGDQDAIKNRDYVTAKMTPAQLAEAQKLAREWKSKSAPH